MFDSKIWIILAFLLCCNCTANAVYSAEGGEGEPVKVHPSEPYPKIREVNPWDRDVPYTPWPTQLLLPMMARFDTPTFAISRWDLTSLALAMAQDGDRGIAGTTEVMGGVDCIGTVDAISSTGQSRRQQAVAWATQALTTKIGQAWLDTWKTLLHEGLQPTPGFVNALPTYLSQIETGVEKSEMVGYGCFLHHPDSWAGWGSPALTSLLLGWLDAPREKDPDDYYLGAAIMNRLYESDPATGRRRILQAILDNDETINIDGLLLLPDEQIPQLDALFHHALHFEYKRNTLACAARYGSPAILQDIRWRYQEWPGEHTCYSGDAMLRYLVKYDRVAGLQLVREAMAMRTKTGCYKSLLFGVLESFSGEDVDDLLESYVQDLNEEVARSAIRTIAHHPSALERLQSISDHFGTKMPKPVRDELNIRLKQTRDESASPKDSASR